MVEGLRANLPREHRHQHTCFQKTRRPVRSKSMIGMKKPRKKEQQQRRKS
jgi:hypothetical protein